MQLPTKARSTSARLAMVLFGALTLGACSADVTSPVASRATVPTTTPTALSGYVVAEGVKKPVTAALGTVAPTTPSALSGYVVAEGVQPVKPLTVTTTKPDSTK